MVYIINNLPQNIGGSSSSGEQSVYFYKEEIDQTKVQEITLDQKMIYSRITHPCSYSYTTDHPGNPLPISIIVGGGKATFFYPDDDGNILSKEVTWNQEITLVGGLQFANIGLQVFIAREKYFYSCDLSKDTPTITRREDIYNTENGTSGGTSCSGCTLGVLFDHYLVSMGGSGNGLRFFYSYEEGEEFKIRFANLVQGSNFPTKYGTCLVIAKDKIFGGYTAYSRSTGYNAIYYCTENTSEHTISAIYLLHPILNGDSFPYADYDYTHLMILWKGGMVIMYTSSDTTISYRKTIVYHGSGTQETITGTGGSAPGMTLSFALSSDTYYYFLGGTSNPKVVQGKISIENGNVRSSENTRHTLNTNSVFCKIPGMNAYYYDGEKTQETTQPILVFSYDPTASLFLSPGSSINHVTVQDHRITFPKSGNPITLQISANAMNFTLFQDRGDGTGGML